MDSERGEITQECDGEVKGKVLNKCFELYEEICQFFWRNGRQTAELRDEKWWREPAFLCFTTKHGTALNLQVEGWGCVITDLYDAVRPFQAKLCLWETHIRKFGHFLCCQKLANHVSTAVFLTAHFADNLGTLGTFSDTISRRFIDFGAQKSKYELLSNPLAADVERAPVNIQMELTKLKCNNTLKAKYDSVGTAVCKLYPQNHASTPPTRCLNALHVWKHIPVSSFPLLWRWRKTHGGVVSLMQTFTRSWGFPQERNQKWTGSQEKMPNIWLWHMCIKEWCCLPKYFLFARYQICFRITKCWPCLALNIVILLNSVIEFDSPVSSKVIAHLHGFFIIDRMIENFSKL